MKRSPLAALLFVIVLLSGAEASAAGPTLVRIDRGGPGDREALIAAGVPLVLEREDLFLAVGEPSALQRQLQALGRTGTVLDADVSGAGYWAVTLRAGRDAGELLACGEPLLVEGSFTLLRATGDLPAGCAESAGWFLRKLTMAPLRPAAPLPEPYASWQRGATPLLDVNPVVQTIVDGLSGTAIEAGWDEIINVATTRYSTSAGCTTATDLVFNGFQALGLNPVRQVHRSNHAPNVIGTITGYTHPERVVIVIGHIDDMPSSGLAPGADDNASGAATVVSAARAMAGYTYENTVKFLAVTGEEQGLYGSEYYAAQAAAAGEQILAVLDADMTAWQGDGLPATGEDLDVNTNTSSAWLGTLMQQAATAYGTGCVVKAFPCASMVYSDHAPFWDHGWSAICAITDNEGSCGQAGSYPYYHTSNDTRANCGNATFYRGAVKAFVATAAHLAVPLCGGGAFPPVPTGVAAADSGPNAITVSWASGGAGLEYEVLRGRGGCGAASFVPVATTATTHWIDTNVSGGVTYAYRIRAKRGECVTADSACTTATTTGACQEYPEFAGAASAGNGAAVVCTVNVSWAAAVPLCAGPVTYNVYRGTSASFVPSASNRIATGVSGLSWADAAALSPGAPAYYVVRAVDAGNGAEDRNTVVRSATPTGPIASATWTDDAGDTGGAAMTAGSPWAVEATGGHSGPRTYKAVATNNACGVLTTPPLLLGAGSQVTFWTKWFLDAAGGDKGQVEISKDGGATWARVVLAYPATSSRTGDACSLPAGQKYFTGINTNWTRFEASLSGYAGSTVRLRFRISTDGATTGETWWIDDLAVTNVQTPGACTTGTVGLEPRGLSVDAASFVAGSSNANGVLEPGEQVRIAPTWHNASASGIAATGTAGALSGPAGAAYTFLDAAASYGTIAAGADGSSAGDPYAIGVDDPAVRPAAHWDLTFLETLATGATKTWTVHVGRSFTDVPMEHWAYVAVEAIYHRGVTIGCGPAVYCPSNPLKRAEMAVLLLRAEHVPGWEPPAPTGAVFSDVSADYWAGGHIEALAAEGITLGCGSGKFCPENPVTRAEMAAFLIRARHGAAWTPPAATGTVFQDVPASHWASAYIEALADEGITQGCGNGSYCPESPVSRAEMAVFLTRAFDLTLP